MVAVGRIWMGAVIIAAWTPLTLIQDQAPPLRWPLPKRAQKAVPDVWIEARSLARALRDSASVVAVDLRGEPLFQAGHVERAVSLSLQVRAEEAAAVLRRRLGAVGIAGSETVVLYDGGGNLDRAARLYWLMARAGVGDLRVLQGGFAAWQEAGLPVESQARAAAATTFSRPERPDVEVSADWLRAHSGDADVQVLDVRDAQVWEKYEVPARFAAGHIARSLPFAPDWLAGGDAGRWLSPPEIRHRLGSFGPRANDPVDLDSLFVVYGESIEDARAWRAALLLASAGLRTRLYPGGWRDWQARGNPVVRVVSVAEVRQLLVATGADPAVDTPRPDGVRVDLGPLLPLQCV
jgi:3-mercaptopyruvate sulfurtransferase SseA